MAKRESNSRSPVSGPVKGFSVLHRTGQIQFIVSNQLFRISKSNPFAKLVHIGATLVVTFKKRTGRMPEITSIKNVTPGYDQVMNAMPQRTRWTSWGPKLLPHVIKDREAEQVLINARDRRGRPRY